MAAPTSAQTTIATRYAIGPARSAASRPTWWKSTVPPMPASAMVARLTSPAYPTSSTNDRRMIPTATALLTSTRGAGSRIRVSPKMMTRKAAPATAASWPLGIAKRSRSRRCTAPRSRSCGNTNSTTNSRIIGTATRRFPRQSNDAGMRPVGRSNAIRVAKPSTSAPTKVSGRLRNRPNMAAAKALITSSVRSVVLSDPPLNGVMRIPASADSETPSIQLTSDVRSGRPPVSCNSGRSSTTARMATPVRVRYSRRRRPTASATATATTVTSCHSSTTPNSGHLVAGAEEGLDGVGLVRLPDPVGQADDREKHRDRHHQLHDLRRVDDAGDHHLVEPGAQQRRHHEEHGGQRQRSRPRPVGHQRPVSPGVVPQVPVDIGAEHPERAVGEVEDARRGVGDHQPARGDREDRAGHEAVDEQAHALPPPPVDTGPVGDGEETPVRPVVVTG